MMFASDNSGPAHPNVMAALMQANEGYAMGYGADEITSRVVTGIRDLFEAPEASVFLVATGTAANSVALATMVQPYQTIYCSEVAHIHEDECNAPEFYTGGAKLTLVPGGDRMTPETLRRSIGASSKGGVHQPQDGAVSITNVAEHGNVYTVAEIAALSAVAKEAGMPVHLDGARFANACVRLGCTPAEMTWKAGVDVAVFGGTKNGCLGVEAVIFFNPEGAGATGQSWAFELRRKRGGHLFSKHRYLSAQMDAYLADNLWRESAQAANDTCDVLAAGLQALGVKIANPTWGNVLFFEAPLRVHRALQAKGAVYHIWGGAAGPDDAIATGRLVCDWSLGQAPVDAFLSALTESL